MSNTIFILGTPFSGSTILGKILSTIDNTQYVGEIDRITQFSMNEYPNDFCEVCQGFNCPIYTKDLIKSLEINGPNYHLYQILREKLSTQNIIDGSKHIIWFRKIFNSLIADGLNAKKMGLKVIVTVRNPISFSYSYNRSLKEEIPYWQISKIWRETYLDIFRTLNILGVDYIIVKNESLCLDYEHVKGNIENYLNLSIPSLNTFDPRLFHTLGGNPNVANKEKKNQSIKLNINNESFKKLSENSANQIVSEPGTFDMAVNFFGYSPRELIFNQ